MRVVTLVSIADCNYQMADSLPVDVIMETDFVNKVKIIKCNYVWVAESHVSTTTSSVYSLDSPSVSRLLLVYSYKFGL